MRERTADMTTAEQKILSDVEEHGIHVVTIPEDEAGPGYSFSVGMQHSFGHPEVVVFGLSEEIARALINLVADEVADGSKFDAGTETDALLNGYPARFMAVPRDMHGEYLGALQWAYEGADFAAVQLVYPDKRGRWPWVAGVQEGFRKNQPVLEKRGEGA